MDRCPGRVGQPWRPKWREWERTGYRGVERALNSLARSWAAWHPSAISGAGPGPAEVATPADVLACYRLLLGRRPDTGGLDHYRRRVAEGLTVGDLVEEFLGSVEFCRAHPGGHKAGPPPSEVVTTGEGFRMHVDPTDFAVGHTIARTGIYEPDVSATVRQVLRTGQCFVDIGANIGWFSLLGASLVGPTGLVVAIEPNPRNVALLEHSAKENGFHNIEVVAVAVAETAGTVALETDGSNGRIIAIQGPPAQPVEASYVVAAYPLDTVLAGAGVGRVDAIKMDVEGAEPLVLRGAAATIARDRPVLSTEFYPQALESSVSAPEAYLAELRRLGYRLSVIGEDGDHDDDAIMSRASGMGQDQVNLLAVPIFQSQPDLKASPF